MDFVTPIYQQIELVPASEAKEMAEKAPFIHEQHSVSHAIRNAANTGAFEVRWSKPLSDEMVAILRENGYTVSKVERAANPDWCWTISWK